MVTMRPQTQQSNQTWSTFHHYSRHLILILFCLWGLSHFNSIPSNERHHGGSSTSTKISDVPHHRHHQQPRKPQQAHIDAHAPGDLSTTNAYIMNDVDELETGVSSSASSHPRPDDSRNNQKETIVLSGDEAKIQVASDLHIEFYGTLEKVPDDIIVPKAPVLALLGDIALSHTDLLKGFLHLQADRFQYVLFLAGNHEFYNSHHGDYHQKFTVKEQLEWMKSVCDERPNLYFVERQVVELGGVRILGTTLWSNIPTETVSLAERSMNDYQLSFTSRNAFYNELQRMTATYTNSWHASSVSWLEEQLEQADQDNKPVIVLTHHTPAMKGTSHPQYDDSPLNVCFSTDLTRLLSSGTVHAWACGHTHYNFDYFEGSVQPKDVMGARLVSNQRGYPSQAKNDYDPEGVIIHVRGSTTRH